MFTESPVYRSTILAFLFFAVSTQILMAAEPSICIVRNTREGPVAVFPDIPAWLNFCDATEGQRETAARWMIENLFGGAVDPAAPDAWIPGSSVLDVLVEDDRLGIWLLLPENFSSILTDVYLDELTLAVVNTMGQIGIRRLWIAARLPGESDYQPLSAFLPDQPPPPQKPFETSETNWPGQPGSSGQNQYAGSMSGKSIFLSQSHGWYYNVSVDAWITQRGNTEDIVEDFINAEAINQYLIHYLWNAGAGVYTCRERDMNVHEVIVDNTDSGYTDSGGWTTSTSTSGYYGANYRVHAVSPEGGAAATWTPVFPGAGWYSVYAWYTGGSNRSTEARYIVHHQGGQTEVIQDQQRDGYTWKCLGFYYFDPAAPTDQRHVELTNEGSDPSKYVIADAVRFGGGMGSIADGGSVSGRPRWEESGRYFAQYMGCSTCGTSTVSSMPRYAAWENESWEDSIYFSWHTNAPNPGTGTSSFVYTSGDWGDPFEGVEGSLELQDFVHTEILNDIRAGYDASWQDRGQWTADFGEVNPSNNSEMPALLIELAFHDTPSDATYLKDPKFRMLSARAIYQGMARFFAWKDGTSAHLLPEPPERFHMQTLPGNQIRIAWSPPPSNTGDDLLGDPATGYRVYLSQDGISFDNAIDLAGTEYTLSGLQPGDLVFARITSTNQGGESFPSPTLAARIPFSGSAQLLIVDGFDRLDRYALIPQYESEPLRTDYRMFLWKMNTFNYAVTHAKAALSHGCGIDSCVNEAVAQHDVTLSDYSAIDWICGEDSTVDETFSTAEQSKIINFLDAGGGFFTSGTEIGWDLDAYGNSADRFFYNTYLKADYLADDAGVYEVEGPDGSIFDGMESIAFDDASAGVYNADYPDIITPVNGASQALWYAPGSNTAGISFDGSYRLVYLAFPLETIVSPTQREQVMERILVFLTGSTFPTPTPSSSPAPTMTPQQVPVTSTGSIIILAALMTPLIVISKMTMKRRQG